MEEGMIQTRRNFLALCAAGPFAGLAPHAGFATVGYPGRPIRIIVPYAAGGPNDTMARLIAGEAFRGKDASFVIENIPGGAGNTGTAAAARAPADGYTLVVVTSSFLINPSLNAKIQYDPVSSFAPVCVIAAAPHVLVVHPSFPAREMTEFVAEVRVHPGKYCYASAGTGQSSHLAGELFKQSTGLDLVHVPFNGANPAMMSTIGNHTPISFISLPAAAIYIKEDRLRGLATTGSARSEDFAEVPTMAEASFSDQVSYFMQGILLPARTPRELVDQWHREIRRVLELPDVRQRVSSLGLEPVVNTPDEFAAQIQSEVSRWSKVIRQAHITLSE
jgi:tripartite-type tricarboxylate transporter receptor subunit TctC